MKPAKIISQLLIISTFLTFTVSSVFGVCTGDTMGNWNTSSAAYAGNGSVSSSNPDNYTITVTGNGSLDISITSINWIGVKAYLYSGSSCLGTSQDLSISSNSTGTIHIDSVTDGQTYSLLLYGDSGWWSSSYQLSGTFTAVVTNPPVMGDVPDQDGIVGEAYNLDTSTYVELTDGDPILSYTLTGSVPAGLSFDTTTGILSGTPTIDGTFSFSIFATDKDGDSNSDDFSITISPQTPPIMGNVPNKGATNGNGFNLDISTYVTPTNGDPITSYTLTGSIPAGLSFDAITGILSGTPTLDGVYNLSVLATDDDGDSNSDNFSITVGVFADVDLSISKTSSSTIVNTLSPMSYILLVSNLDTNNSALNVTVEDTLPTGMSFVSNTGGSWSCTSIGSPEKVTCELPTLAASTSSSLTLNVTSGDSTVPGHVTFVNEANVTSINGDTNLSNNSSTATVILNRPPTVSDDTTSANAHTDATGNVLLNDTDLDGDSLVISNPGTFTLSFGSITIMADGSYTYSPGYFTGETDEYTYQVDDGHGGLSTGKLRITILSGCLSTGVQNSARNFCLRKQALVFGNMVTIGNTILVPPNPQPATCAGYTNGAFSSDTGTNSNADLVLCNYQVDAGTINSTSAQLLFPEPANSTIKWAGLYVQSIIDTTTSFTGTNPSINKIRIKNGASSYQTVGAPIVLNYGDIIDNYNSYSAFFDVTTIFKTNNWGSGNYTVADIPVTTDIGWLDGLGKYGAWTLVVIYENPDEPLKSVSVYDGWQTITDTNNVNITIKDFYTPTSGSIVASTSVFTAEGDKVIDGDHFKSGVKDLGNPTDNAFNSGITTTGTRIPSLANNQGIDIKTYDLGTTGGTGLLSNGQSSINFTFSSDGDYYFPSMLAFSTDVYTPKMCYYENLYDSTGNLLSQGELVDKGSEIRARLLLKNTNNEPAEKVLLYRTFDDTMPYVFNSTRVNNDDSITHDINSTLTTPVTDNLDTDVFDYSTAIDLFSLHAGTGATYNQGGDFDVNQTSLLDYNLTANFEGNTSIVYQVAFTMPTIGYRYEGQLSKCVDFNNTFGVKDDPVELSGNIDVIEKSLYSDAGSYAGADKEIFTKVVNKPFDLEVVYLDDSGNQKIYDGTIGSKIVNMAVMLYTTDTLTCSNKDQLIWSGEIANNTSHSTAYIDGTASSNQIKSFLLENAFKNKKIKAEFIDYGTLINNASGLTCSTSSLNSTLCLVPACLNSDIKIKQAFPPSEFPYIDICLNGDGGGTAPCNSSAYNGNCGGKKTTISPPQYNTDVGCAQCIADALGMNSCSSDNFAARPDHLNLSSTDTDMPNLLRSADDYNVSINAYNYSTTINTPDYNVTDAQTAYNINITTYNKNNIVDTNMSGTASFASTAFNMYDGVSKISPTSSDEVASITFDDVGKINFQIQDKDWATIDIGETSDNCNTTYVCGDMNVTFIPDHFDFNNLTLTNNNGNPGSFTYLANDLDKMAGRVDTQIRALNKNNAVTQNFAPFPLYGNNVTVTQTVTKASYLHPDANATAITNLSIGFVNGVKNIGWNENNSSIYLRYNFQRNVNQTANPFDVNGSDYNISVLSQYTDGAKVANITDEGNTTVSGKTTFVYGRTHTGTKRYEGNTGTANIYYEVYCFGQDSTLVPCDIPTIQPIATDLKRTNDLRWYINRVHTAPSDGTIGTVTQKGGTYVNATIPTNNNPGNTTLTYDESSGYIYITTMENNASGWLIENENNPGATTNEFQVEFNKADSGWSGEHETNTTTNDLGTATINRRTMW